MPGRIEDRILTIRGQRVLLDSDLAALYGVPTKRLNEQVKRNARKFPSDFVFQVTVAEAQELRTVAGQAHDVQPLADNRSQIATGSRRHRDPRFLPYAFTEHGAIQAANVLNSDAATDMSVHVVRAFVQLRQLLTHHKVLHEKLAELDARVGAHDEHLAAIIDAIRKLTAAPRSPHDRKIGFHRGNR